jgi:hypothetical protein
MRRSVTVSRHSPSVCHNPGLETTTGNRGHISISYALAESSHQYAVVDAVKELLQIRLHRAATPSLTYVCAAHTA